MQPKKPCIVIDSYFSSDFVMRNTREDVFQGIPPMWEVNNPGVVACPNFECQTTSVGIQGVIEAWDWDDGPNLGPVSRVGEHVGLEEYPCVHRELEAQLANTPSDAFRFLDAPYLPELDVGDFLTPPVLGLEGDQEATM